jgi:DegV family protein with EDD domain
MASERPSVAIVTDSTSDLRQLSDQQSLRGIQFVEALIALGNESRIDRPEDIATPELLQWMTDTQEVPTTGAPPAPVFEGLYRSIPAGRDILSVHIASELSQFVAQATVAKTAMGEDGDRVTVLDSRGISLALGYQALEARRLSETGMPVADIVGALEDMQSRSHLFVAFKTLDNARLSGRISHIRGLMGSILGLKPVLELEHGRFEQESVNRTWGKARDRLVADIAASAPFERLGILHAGAPDIEIADMVDRLQPSFPSRIDVALLGPTLATHAGPGAIAVCGVAAKPVVFTSRPQTGS